MPQMVTNKMLTAMSHSNKSGGPVGHRLRSPLRVHLPGPGSPAGNADLPIGSLRTPLPGPEPSISVQHFILCHRATDSHSQSVRPVKWARGRSAPLDPALTGPYIPRSGSFPMRLRVPDGHRCRCPDHYLSLAAVWRERPSPRLCFSESLRQLPAGLALGHSLFYRKRSGQCFIITAGFCR